MIRKHNTVATGIAARRLLRLAGNPGSVKSAISIIASKLLEGVSTPPTDLDAIMEKLNVAGCEEREDVAGCGALAKDGPHLKILYCTGLAPGRRRWTVAHELGHAVFESTGPNPPRSGHDVERLCNRIAAEILLPRHFIVSRLPRQLSVSDVFRIAREFDTSLEAAAIRCVELRRVSVFQAKQGKVLRGHGLVRNDRDAASDRSLRRVVSASAHRDHGEERLALVVNNRAGWWIADWQSMGSGGLKLFLLRPEAKEQSD